MPKILVINGPNINMLGTREPELYGADTYDDLVACINAKASSLGVSVDVVQSNSESELVDIIQNAKETIDGIVINPAAYSHTSIAILDSLYAVDIPTVEVHISNIYAREEFRHHSFVSQAAKSVIAGCGIKGYEYALEQVLTLIKEV